MFYKFFDNIKRFSAPLTNTIDFFYKLQFTTIAWLIIIASLFTTGLCLFSAFVLNESIQLETLLNGLFKLYLLILGDSPGSWGAISLSILFLYFGIDLLALLIAKTTVQNGSAEQSAKPWVLNMCTHLKLISGLFIVTSSLVSVVVLFGSDSASFIYHYFDYICPVAIGFIIWTSGLTKYYRREEHRKIAQYLPLAICVMVILSDLPQFYMIVSGLQATGNLGILFANMVAFLLALASYGILRPFWRSATDRLSQVRLFKGTVEARLQLNWELPSATKTAMLQFLIVSRLLINLLTAEFLGQHTIIELPIDILHWASGFFVLLWLSVVHEFVCCSVAMSKAEVFGKTVPPFEPFLFYDLLCYKVILVYYLTFLRYFTAMQQAVNLPVYKQLETRLPESDWVYQKAKSIGTHGWFGYSIAAGFSILGCINPVVGLDTVWIEALGKHNIIQEDEVGSLKCMSMYSTITTLKNGLTSMLGAVSIGGVFLGAATAVIVYENETLLKPEICSASAGLTIQNQEFHDIVANDEDLQTEVNKINQNTQEAKDSTNADIFLGSKRHWSKDNYDRHAESGNCLRKINEICKERYNYSLKPIEGHDPRLRPSSSLFNNAVEYGRTYVPKAPSGSSTASKPTTGSSV